jgi:RNA-binding protein 25
LLPPIFRSRQRRRSRSSSRHSRSISSRQDSRARRSRSLRRSPKRKARKRSRSSSASSRSSTASSSSTSSKGKAHSRSRSRSRESEDSDEIYEKRRLKREVRDKEESYRKRLDEWEKRERRMAKQYAKDEEEEIKRKKMILKEAKKLRQFLEDYEDERDDAKYYKSSSLFQRRRDYEREREADAKDRQEEIQEIEEIKKQILAENKNADEAEAEAKKRHEEQEKVELRRFRANSGSPTPHRPLGQKSNENHEVKMEPGSSSEGGTPGENASDIKSDGAWASLDGLPAADVKPIVKAAPPSPKRPTGKVVTTIKRETIEHRLNGFNEEEEEDTTHIIKKKLKPFEITREERILAMTPEERKKMIRELIERIPTTKDELFAFTLDWTFVDDSLVEQRVKPWVNKKISEYIGEEEPTLVAFVCEKVMAQTEPRKILADLAMVLDDEAEVFMLKMWRLIIYESEAKKLGLTSSGASKTTI